MDREKQIVKLSIWGIVMNLVLVGFKATVGFFTNSISIILDAVNNFTDVLSSVVTIIGVKLAGRRPDRKHPFGHGRVEYFSAMIVAMVILITGAMAMKESIGKITQPEEADYSVVSLIIIAVAVMVKFFFGQYIRRRGKELHSNSLVASGVDAISDAALSFSVLVGAIISFVWHISLEGYIGVIIAAMIIKTAVEILIESSNELIGVRVDNDIAEKIKKTILKFDEVEGVYDLALHNYGPNKLVASAHIQISDDMKTRAIHKLSREIEVKVFEKYGAILTLGVYASNESGKYKKMKEFVEGILDEFPTLLQMHGFYVDEEEKTISFDLVFSFEEIEATKKMEEIRKRVSEKYEGYRVFIILDADTAGEIKK
ncbi:cation transporter [Candidatus Saccharibacteria bacterium]|nr:cation transporter [Candidatus Saccharibacteria bacterium]